MEAEERCIWCGTRDKDPLASLCDECEKINDQAWEDSWSDEFTPRDSIYDN